MIRKAVIPIAGLGTRMQSITKGAPKALLPIAGAAGRSRAVIDLILAEVGAAGIEQVCLVVSPGQQPLVQQHLDAADGPLPAVTFVQQDQPAGFGDAVLLARRFVGPESFMVLLGDHLRLPVGAARPCAAQVAEAADGFRGSAVVGVQVVGADQLCLVGVCAGESVVADHVYRCLRIVEKPDPATAAELTTPGLPPNRYLAHAGIYIFSPEIFACLDELAGGPGELGLTAAQERLLARHGEDYYLIRIAGNVHDAGCPDGYADAVAAFRARD